MEVALPSSPPAMDFDRPPPPFLSAPSSPRRYADLSFSAPTSPNRISEFYRSLHDEFDGIALGAQRNPSAIPFRWEERPGTPKSPASKSEDEFAFAFSGDSVSESRSADELFDGGKIRPLKPPPRSQFGQSDDKLSSSPRSPIAQGKRIIKDAFSPKKKKDPDFDPFEAAAESMRNRAERGRERGSLAPMSSARPSRRATRSLSPYRVLDRQLEEDEVPSKKTTNQPLHNSSKSSTSSLSSSSSSSSSKRSRKWRLRDFLLFRSASEGDKDSLKYTSLFRKQEDVRNGSSRPSPQRSGSGGSGSRRKGQPVSAHELHYTANRAVSEDMKKKTFLPYKKNIFGFGAFARK